MRNLANDRFRTGSLRRMVVLVATLSLASCGEGDDEVSARDSDAKVPAGVTVEGNVARHVDGWILHLDTSTGEPCVRFEAPFGGGDGCGRGMTGSQNATIMPAEVRDEFQASLPGPVPDALFENAFIYGAAPADTDAVRVTTNLGARRTADVIRMQDSDYVAFIVTFPAREAPLEMEVVKVEFGERASPGSGGDLNWTVDFSLIG